MTTLLRGHRGVWKQLVLWGIVSFLLWGALRAVPLSDIWVTIRRIHLSVLLLLFAVNLLILWCFGGRGWLILLALGHRIPYHRQVAYRLAAFSINYFTPVPQFGGEPLHIYLLHRHHAIPLETAVATVAVDKLLEMMVNIAFLLLGIVALIALDALPTTARAPLLCGSMTLVLLPLLYFATLAQGRLPLSYIAHRLSAFRIVQALRFPLLRIAQAELRAGRLCRTHLLAMVQAFVLTVATWGLLIGEYALMMRALDVRLSLIQTIAVLTAARLAFLFPAPAGLGALEASQALAVRALGLDPALGVAVSLLIRFRDILVGLTGLLIARKYA